MTRALITGVAGQDGSYLAELLLDRGYEVVGLEHASAGRDAPNLSAVADRLGWITADLHDPVTVRSAVCDVQPDELYHLAAPTFVPDSWDDPTATMTAIAGGTSAILSGALACEQRPRVWVATSSEIFGAAPESPQNERTPMRPRSPYGVAKLAAHGLVGAMREHHGLFACAGITYNHESPRRPPRFLPRKVTRAAAAIALGQQEELSLGDLDAVRDWTDARDVVHAAWLALQADDPDDYVLASGTGRTVRELAQVAFAAAGLGDDISGRVRVDPAFVRAREPIPLIGDPSRARERLGWTPEISFEAMIAEMVAADFEQLSVA